LCAQALHRDDKRPNGANKVIFCRSMLDKRDYFVGPMYGVVDGSAVTVNYQKLSHRNESSSFITLLKGMCLSQTSQQSDS